LIVLGLGVPRVARADQLVVKGENHLGAKVLNLEEGQLSVRLGDGRVQGFRIDEIDLLIVDRGGVFEDFNQADRFLSAGEAEKAAVRFERALRLCSDFWPDVCAARLVKAYDRTGQLDKATLNFIRLARGRFAGPAAAARLIPQNVPARRDAKFTRAVDQLDSALAEEPGESRRVLFEALRYEILRRTGDDRTGRSAEALAVAPVPADVRSEAVYALVQLALREAFTSAPTADRWAALDRAIADCPKGSLPGFFLLKGDVMLSTASSRDDLIRASWPFLRIAAHAPDDPRAADGLLGGATVLERIGRADQAIGLLEECLGQSQVGDETRRRAEESLTRLRLAREGSDASEKVKR
jgi:tetratricopeptide (TPR) repeat protein